MTKVREFRASMGWLHTWTGIAVSGLLFAIFWMGSLSVFDKEIDQWMRPEIRLPAAVEPVALDPLVRPILENELAGHDYANIRPPSARRPYVAVGYLDGEGAYQELFVNPHTGDVIDATDSKAGSRFIFPFHFELHIKWRNAGRWIVGFCAVAMLVLLVSGIFVHRKIIEEFFTFRPKKKLRRAVLDLHNLTSLIALPFHILFPLTGLFIFFSTYLPWSITVPFGDDKAAFQSALHGVYQAERSGDLALPMMSIDALRARAETLWSERIGAPAKADVIRALMMTDANAHILFRRTFPARQISMNQEITVLNAHTGEVLSDFKPGPVDTAKSWLEGLHFVQFDHWTLRWLYFFGGLSGCAMIATGLIFWIRARVRDTYPETAAVRAVRALSIGSITGIIAATAIFLISNRLLPKEATLMGEDRASLEIWAFFLAWLVSFLHAAIAGRNAWAQQCLLIAGLGSVAVILNWITTGDHILRAGLGGLLGIAGMDVVILLGSAAAIVVAAKLRRRQPNARQSEPPTYASTTAAE